MSNNQLPDDKELILEKHCPSMSLLYLDSNGRAFRERILKAMEDYAGATEYATKLLEAQQEKAKAVDFLRRLRSITTWLDMPDTSVELCNTIDNFLK